MQERFDRVFASATVVNQNGVAAADIGVRGGRIAAIGDLGRSDAGERVDCAGLHILPGVIDSQVHFREPGLEHKENLESGARAAVLGGVTAVFEMPNTKPLTTDAAALRDKLDRAGGRMHCDYAFWVGGTHDNWRDVAALEQLPGVAGIKVFMGSSTGDLLLADDAGVERILKHTRHRVAFHCEDEARLASRAATHRVPGDPASHPLWRDEETALSATKRLITIARRTGARVHVLHLTTAEECAFLADHKDVASIEVTPHHLTLTDEAYDRLGSYAQMNPPVRAARHRDALWQAVRNGLIDVLGSDHAPHTRAEKDRPYPQSPSGMTGVQTLVPLMLDHVNAGRLTLERFVDMTAAGPARLFGIARKGRIAVGYDADFTVADLQARRVIENRWIASKVGWTPYDGVAVTGWPIGTVVRGARVMWEDTLLSPHSGAPVSFV